MEEKKETKVSPWPWHAVKGTEIKWICGEWREKVRWYIEDAQGFRVTKACNAADNDGVWNAAVMAAAPELREELEKLVKRSCSMCAAEMKAAITPQNKPCEDGRPCPYGLDGAKKAIDKSYGRE